MGCALDDGDNWGRKVELSVYIYDMTIFLTSSTTKILSNVLVFVRFRGTECFLLVENPHADLSCRLKPYRIYLAQIAPATD